MPQISQATQKLTHQYQNWHQSLQIKGSVPTIHIDEIASKVASFYEKIKGVVDWREEHLLRKTAIEKAIKRRLLLNKRGEEIAEPLVYELVRGGHFPNDKIPESKIKNIKSALDKYLYILNNSPQPPTEKLKFQLYDWIFSIAACEIEEILSPPIREKALLDYMTELMKERIAVTEGVFKIGGLSESEKNIQIYIAVQRALFNFDPPLISYNLLRNLYPEWENLYPQTLEEITKNIYSIWGNIEKTLKHPLANKFYQVAEKYDTPYLLVGDIITKDPMGTFKLLENPAIVEKKIAEVYQERLGKINARTKRAAIYSTISIFITKIILVLLIEVPFDKYITSQFNEVALGLSVAIPPLLMFLLVLTIRAPAKENAQKATMEIMKIIYETEKKDLYEIRATKKKGVILNAFVTFIYLLSFVLSFGIIIWGLEKLGFGVLSIAIFLMFISLIAFAGVKIRERAKELVIEEKKGGFLFFILDIFSLPFIRIGKWLSGQWARYNVVVVIFNSLIDMPFQMFIEFIEHWRTFLKEKKEEIH